MELKEILFIALQVFYLILPVLIADISPRLFNNQFKGLKKPISNAVFGERKTWQRSSLHLSAAIITVYVQFILYDFDLFRKISLYEYSHLPILFGLLLGIGFVFGDLLFGFIEKRSKVNYLLKKISIFFWAFLMASALFVPRLDTILFCIIYAILYALFKEKYRKQ